MTLPKLFVNLFDRPRPALTQNQREAIIDAMTFAMLIDRHIASEEQEALAQQLEIVGWRSPIPVEQAVNASIMRARRALEHDEVRPYCQHISSRLETQNLRRDAYQTVVKIVEADGRIDPEEQALLHEMARAFGIDPAESGSGE